MKIKTLILPLIALPIATGIAVFCLLLDRPIDIATVKGIETTKELISGTWFHSDTICNGQVQYESVREYTFGSNLPSNTINAVKLDRDQIVFSRLEDQNKINLLNGWFTGCGFVDQSEEAPIIIDYNNFSQSRTFFFYPDKSLILALSEGVIFSLVKGDVLFKLRVYQDPK